MQRPHDTCAVDDPVGDGPPLPELLELLVGAIDQAAGAEEGSSLWRVITLPGGDVELGVLRLDAHPFDQLIGFTAPEEWAAIGVRAVGSAHHLDASSDAPRRVAATLAVGRDGTTSSQLRWLDDAGGGSAAVGVTGPVEGLIADALRRALGLPTAPPAGGSASLWALLWLDRLVDAAGDPLTRPRSFAAAVALHPAALAADPDGSWVVADPDHIVAAALDHAHRWSWARLRGEPAALGPVGASLPAAALAWMDDGLFSRWLLGELPAPDDLLDAVGELLPARVAQAVDRVASGLLA